MSVETLQNRFKLSDKAGEILRFAQSHPSPEIAGFSNPLLQLESSADIQEVPNWLLDLYGETRIEALLSNYAQDASYFQQLTSRMPSRITDWYKGLVESSEALKRLVLADPKEIADLSGDADPSRQTLYMPLGSEKGITHKYTETVHVMIILACAAYCRYCYQADFFSGRSGKKTASPEQVKDYISSIISQYWKGYDETTGSSIDLQTGKELFPITNVLLTGGDSLQASNFLLALFIVSLAESGISHIRFGSKVPIFQPMRGDENFFAMLDMFHDAYPHLTFSLVTHISHPDELLRKDSEGRYISIYQAGFRTPYYEWHEPTANFFKACASRSFINIANQFPQIKGINDNSGILALLLREAYKHGIHAHNIYACRQIRGHKHFELPIAKAFENVVQANIQLDGLSGKGRLILSTRYGKMLIEEAIKPCALWPRGMMLMRRIRLPQGEYSTRHNNAGGVFITEYDPQAVWIDDLMDKVIHDEVTTTHA